MRDMVIPERTALIDNLGKIAYTLDKAYLSNLDSEILEFEDYNKKNISYSQNIRALEIERWVYDKGEKISDCFKNVMSVFSGSEKSLALVIKRRPEKAEMYFVIKNAVEGGNDISTNDINLLLDSLRGNFPGTKASPLLPTNGDVEKCFDFENYHSISALCNVPSEKSEDYISQGIDKLLNGIVPKDEDESYFVVILAESLPQSVLREILSGYQEMATAITPFAGHQFQIGKTDTKTEGEMESLAHSDGISHSVNKTHSVNVGVHTGVNASISPFGVGMGGYGGISLGYGYSWGTSDGTSKTDTKVTGTNFNVSVGNSENATYTYKSYVVLDLIEKLEATIKRINESHATGLWRCASYILAKEPMTSKNIANYLRSITQGDDSYIEPSFINEWSYKSGNNEDITTYGEALQYIKHFCHPVFRGNGQKIIFTPTMNVSTSELSKIFAFPRYSVKGLPVIECARFGREPRSLSGIKADVKIGCSYHMHSMEEQSPISLDKNELTKHTFVTGSTGSGKSNTLYKLIEELCFEDKSKTKFLVIEPAKGEYKDFFGGRDDVITYGTNPFKFPNLLQINPFSFPPDIHVLEHIDRLVEVFNACWPMYAAMPAILREAVEKSYERVNWNLKLSKNPGCFPTFATLLTVLPDVIESSEYSSDTSSDYRGALKTRVRSLTRGIHGQIFAGDIDSDDLFNKNVIVDISRVGSTETKALIMGVIVLKLQEFRMSEAKHNEKNLRHVTVLEEAHNLLRRTSSEQSRENSNLQGKSVEMLSNAIAEMRTYGEGFIIADQSPGLMDMSVIRNTNTKIILRLPDESDRVLVGKAAGLNEPQIAELSRLEVGVAAVSQSGWLEPVLCKIDEFKNAQGFKETPEFQWNDIEGEALRKFLDEVFKPADVERVKLSRDVIDKVRAWRDTNEFGDTAYSCIEQALSGYPLIVEQQLVVAAAITENRLCKISNRVRAVEEVTRSLIGQYGFTEDDKIIRRVNDLLVLHSPVSIYTEINRNAEIYESEVIP